jgi:NAD(P)-dependent dehydrogenase (short-subunit alcohol dehydrogenase family)
MAIELAPYGVRVNAVCPGPIYTELNKYVMNQRSETLALTQEDMVERIRRQIPLGRWGEPADIALAVAFLCGPGASWITGEVIRVSGGLDGISAVPPKRPSNPH